MDGVQLDHAQLIRILVSRAMGAGGRFLHNPGHFCNDSRDPDFWCSQCIGDRLIRMWDIERQQLDTLETATGSP